MLYVRILVGAGGIALVGSVALSSIRTVIVPRSQRTFVGAVVFRGLRRIFSVLAAEGRGYSARDRVMALYGPVALVLLAVFWLALVWLGYVAVFWSVGYGDGSVNDAAWVSGSSLLTLGSAPLDHTGIRAIAFTEAVYGLGLLALMISFLPSMYAAFSRRERLVALLEVRAGTPPSAAEWLERFHRIGWTQDLADEWMRWESWFVDIDETHTTHPALVWFRSPQPDRSWVVAAGTVLDAASLWLAAVDHPPDPRAGLCIRAGYLALRRIADFFGIAHDPNPAPTDPISVTRSEFDGAVARMATAGIPVRSDGDGAWRDFVGWRVNYDTVLLRLAELTIAPYAPWTSDRSAPDHVAPRLSRWGLRG